MMLAYRDTCPWASYAAGQTRIDIHWQKATSIKPTHDRWYEKRIELPEGYRTPLFFCARLFERSSDDGRVEELLATVPAPVAEIAQTRLTVSATGAAHRSERKDITCDPIVSNAPMRFHGPNMGAPNAEAAKRDVNLDRLVHELLERLTGWPVPSSTTGRGRTRGGVPRAWRRWCRRRRAGRPPDAARRRPASPRP